jgi:hypothetical protein
MRELLYCHASPCSTLIVHEPKTKYDLSQQVVNHAFSFDRVFGEAAATPDLYSTLLQPLVAGLDRGAQFTCFAYGQVSRPPTAAMSTGVAACSR